MKSGAAKPICVIIPQTSQPCLFWVFPTFSRRRSGGGETFGGQKEEQPPLLRNANGKRLAGSSLVCEAVVCQHSALASVRECVCVCFLCQLAFQSTQSYN